MRSSEIAARVLAGAWRDGASGVEISEEELSEITPMLLKSGGAALGWWRVRNSVLPLSQSALQLQQAYRLHSVRSAVHKLEIQQLVPFLRSKGLEPLLGKGWAIARLYPTEGLRPYGDVDLYIHPDQYPAASAALLTPDTPACRVDLHRGAAELDDRSFGELYDHSQLVRLREVDVRVFGPEDHLRLLCLHTLRHGAWRPLWLCDIAVALESRPLNFDWDYFLSGNPRRSDWVACAIGLAHQILGVRVDDTPVKARSKNLPDWLLPTVLRQWEEGQTPHGSRKGMSHYISNPVGLLEAVRIRWPNAIEATVYLRGPFNGLPRLPFQVGDALLRTARFLTQVPALLRQQ